MRQIRVIVCISFVLAAGTAVPQTTPSRPSLDVLRELAPKWWRWRVALPALALPDKDVAGHFCDVGQAGKTWFIGGLLSFGKALQPVRRTCAIPLGRRLFFPVVTLLRIVNGDVTCSKAQDEVSSGIDKAADVKATLDGVDLPATRFPRWSSNGSCFRLDLPADGPSSALTAAADGYWLLLDPMPAGHHTLVYGATLTTDRTGSQQLQSTTYDLEVE